MLCVTRFKSSSTRLRERGIQLDPAPLGSYRTCKTCVAKSHKPEDSGGYGQRLHNLKFQVSVIVYTHAIKYTLSYITIPLHVEGALQEY